MADEQQQKAKYFVKHKFNEVEAAYVKERGKLLQEKHLISTPSILQMNSAQQVLESGSGSQAIITHRKMPPISLPKFDEKYTEWIGYRDLFKAMVLDSTY